jgi:uncharacterized surface protein with fasciclin (FAS1) repeats
MRSRILPILSAALLAAACAKSAEQATPGTDADVSQQGQAAVQDSVSTPDVVKVAVGSKDHTTLVAALKAADLVNSLANAGPFTVFAPTNAAFEKLPPGTVDDLLKPENKAKLAGVLQHHVAVPVIDLESLADGQVLGVADGGKVTFTRRGADHFIGDAKVLATVRASNGVVYVVDGVLVP